MTINEKFDEEFEPSNIADEGINLIIKNIIRDHNKAIKQFINKEIQELVKEMVGEELEYKSLDLSNEPKRIAKGYKVRGYNQKRQEIIDILKKRGIKL